MGKKGQKVTFVIGGSRSGKSRFALSLAEPYKKRLFIATGLPIDEEMEQRIERHRRERGNRFSLIEEPYHLGKAIRALPIDTEIAIIDCLTVWIGNLLYRDNNLSRDAKEIHAFLSALQPPPCNIVIVSNEVGLGIIPPDPLTRRFRDIAGELNQQTAAIANETYFVVCGLPLKIKG